VKSPFRTTWAAVLTAASCVSPAAVAQRIYTNELTPVVNPTPILADHPEFVQPVEELRRFAAPTLVEDAGGDLDVRAWRFSYNARGIIEMPNRLAGARTAVVVVHPWGIDDGQGWTTPEPAGVAFGCTPEKNRLMLEHAERVVNPFLEALRGRVKVVAYSLPGKEDPIRKRLYRSVRSKPADEDRQQAQRDLERTLSSFSYRGGSPPGEILLSADKPVADYFEAFPGLSAYQHYNPPGFWDLPIPVMRPIRVGPDDVVIYDAEGYDVLRRFLAGEGVRNVLLCGYHADMCVCSTTAGYENLRKDFNVFLVGDAVQASLPANKSAAHSTNHAVSTASLKVLVTQTSWIRPIAPEGEFSSGERR
jgi:nicotinamidase-related amidase